MHNAAWFNFDDTCIEPRGGFSAKSADYVSSQISRTRLFKPIRRHTDARIWWHCLDSTWIIHSQLSVAQIRDHLMGFIDANDDLVIVELHGNWATYGLSHDCN